MNDRRPREILVLSGGGQHGLFGTGFFLGLTDVPTYHVVTGVSTGSLQATMLFLANQPVPTDRIYPPDQGYLPAGVAQGQSNVRDLVVASSVAREGSLLRVGRFGILGGIVRGSIATLAPLRERMLGIISPDTIRAVAREVAQGRSLYVGVTDVDNGTAYAID